MNSFDFGDWVVLIINLLVVPANALFSIGYLLDSRAAKSSKERTRAALAGWFYGILALVGLMVLFGMLIERLIESA